LQEDTLFKAHPFSCPFAELFGVYLFERWAIILLMAEILHQLSLVVYPNYLQGFYTSQVVQDF